MKRLLITTDNFLPRWDGIARFLLELIPVLQKDFEITIACPAFEGPLPVVPGVKLVRFPLVNIRFGDIYFSNFNTRRMRSLVRHHDMVFNQTLGPLGISAIRASSKLKKPIVSFTHSIEWDLVSKSLHYFRRSAGWLMKVIARWMYNKCTLLLVPSKELEELLTLEGISTVKQVVELGVNTEKFIPPINRAEAKKAISISPAVFTITYVGRLAHEKNLSTLQQAFQKIKKEFPNTILLIVGGGTEDFTPDPRVHLLGPQDNVVPYYQASDVYVLPSLTETTSLTTLEAMACGAAVVVTPVGSIREYVDDGKNGLIFPRRDANTLAELLKFLLTHEQTRLALGVEARKTVEEKRSLKGSITKIRNVLVSF
ncbi:MAG TPA: glycosyltransferase family 4 protein [Candidatus Binatia bacterium]|nr:glycosyltransferase family 4 protein [Candidatus Binatia bacterium]